MANTKTTLNDEKLEIIQINLARAFKANQSLSVYQQDKLHDISLIQEPYNLKGKIIGFPMKHKILASKDNPKAAAIIHSEKISVFPLVLEEKIVAFKINLNNRDTLIINCYFPPKENIQHLLARIDEILQTAHTRNILITGDFNSKNITWGGNITDDRGEELIEFIIKNDLIILNNMNSEPTFDCNRGKSWIDLTLVSSGMFTYIKKWEVTKDSTCSDHRYIKIQIFDTKCVPVFKTTKEGERKAVEELLSIDWGNEVINLNSPEDIENTVNKFYNTIDHLFKKHQKRFTKEKKPGKIWWTTDLEIQRKKVRAMKRRYKKCRGDLREVYKNQYYREHDSYVENLASAKSNSWDEFISKVTKNPFNLAYKLARDQLKTPLIISSIKKEDNSSTSTLKETVEYILGKLYTISERETENEEENLSEAKYKIQQCNGDVQFTELEIDTVISGLRKDIAVGPDGLRTEVIQTMYKRHKIFFQGLFNSCLKWGHFPERWKESKIILIPKRKSQEKPGDFRPIAINSIFGKVLEKLLKDRIYFYLNKEHLLLRNQYGFKHLTSTTHALENIKKKVTQALLDKQAVLLISLDIKNAFNSISIKVILEYLTEHKCPENLNVLLAAIMRDRSIIYKNGEVDLKYKLKQGSPQGSPLSPLLWTLMISDLLIRKLPENAYIQAFADDITIIIKGDSKRKLQEIANKTLQIVDNWGKSKNIDFNPAKSQYMILKGRYKKSPPILKLGGNKIQLVDKLKILGVIFDESFTFTQHLDYIKEKVMILTYNLNRFTGKNRGIKGKQMRDIYKRGIERIITYAAPIWYRNISLVVKKLRSIQRKPLLAITKAYKTVANSALNVLANIPPVNLRIEKEIEMFDILHRDKPFIWNNEVFTKDKIISIVDKWKIHPANKVKYSFSTEIDKTITYNIFTDGSCDTMNPGAAFIVFKKFSEIITTRQYALPQHNNNFDAEAIAITKALEYVAQQHNKNSYQIITDSLSTLQGINNPDNLNPYIQKIKEKIAEVNKDHKIILAFIKGHSGNMGNEYADDLAKKAIRFGEKIELPISKKFISSQLNKQIFNKWNTQWVQESNYHKSYIRDWITSINQIPTLFLANHNVSQFMTGHGRFPHYLQRFRIRQNSMCTCGKEANSFDHYLENCKITRKYRDKLKMKFGHMYSKKKTDLLKDREALSILEEMVEEVNKNV